MMFKFHCTSTLSNEVHDCGSQTSPSRTCVNKICVYVYIKYFTKIIQQMKENADFFHFLIETDFLDTLIFPTNQSKCTSVNT